jgi:hypothetical protein
MPRTALTGAAVILFLMSHAVAQDGHFDASANFGAAFGKSTTGNGVTQRATTGSDLFGTFRVRFNSRHGLEFNFGHLKDSQTYQTNNDFHVLTHVTEYSAAYVYRPFENSKCETFIFAGGGALRFNPQSTWLFYNNNTSNPFGVNQTQVNFGASKQTEIAFLYGGGLDYRFSAIPYVKRVPLSSHFAFRIQYRGLLYRAPDFNVAGAGSLPSFFTGGLGHLAVPSAGVVFKF